MKITIRLRPDRDDDIKDWYKSLARGDRSRVIRDVLKEFINHKKSVGKNHACGGDNSLVATGKVEVDIKAAMSTECSEDVIDSKLDNLLDQI